MEATDGMSCMPSTSSTSSMMEVGTQPAGQLALVDGMFFLETVASSLLALRRAGPGRSRPDGWLASDASAPIDRTQRDGARTCDACCRSVNCECDVRDDNDMCH